MLAGSVSEYFSRAAGCGGGAGRAIVLDAAALQAAGRQDSVLSLGGAVGGSGCVLGRFADGVGALEAVVLADAEGGLRDAAGGRGGGRRSSGHGGGREREQSQGVNMVGAALVSWTARIGCCGLLSQSLGRWCNLSDGRMCADGAGGARWRPCGLRRDVCSHCESGLDGCDQCCRR